MHWSYLLPSESSVIPISLFQDQGDGDQDDNMVLSILFLNYFNFRFSFVLASTEY